MKRKIYEIEGKKYTMIDGKLIEVVNKNQVKERQETHDLKEISTLLKKMSKTELKSQFGLDIGRNKKKPYSVIGVKNWFENMGITSDNPYFRPRLTYENKHQIIEQLLKGEKTTKRKNVKTMCINHLKEKISNPPDTIRGKPPSEKMITSINNALQNEINRWG